MQHVVNKAVTGWIAAHLISGHLAHTGNHRHWSAGQDRGRDRAPEAADVQVLGGLSPIEGGRL